MTERVPPAVTRWAEAHAASARRGPRGLRWPVAGGPRAAPRAVPGGRVRVYGTPRERYSFRVWEDRVWSASDVAWSPDGRSLAACGDGGWLVRWDLDAGAEAERFDRAQTFRARAVDWVTTRDGRTLLLSDGPDFSVQVWDPATRSLLRTLTGLRRAVHAVAAATLPDGRAVVAAGGEDDAVRVWDVHTGESLAAFTRVGPGVRTLAWHVTPGGRALLALASRTGEAVIWQDAPRRGRVRRLGGAGGARLSGPTGLAWVTAPDGRTLLATSEGSGHATIWDASGTFLRTFVSTPVSATGVSWFAGGPGQLLLATGSVDGGARVWDADGHGVVAGIAHDAGVNAVAFQQDPEDGHLLLATACDDGHVRVHDVGEPVDPPARAASPDARRDPDVAPLTVRLADPPFAVLDGHPDLVWTTARSDDGLLVTGSRDPVIRVWDVGSRRTVRMLRGHDSIVRTLATTRSPSGRSLLASGGYDGAVLVWDLDSGRRLATMREASQATRLPGVMRVEWIPTSTGDMLLACGDLDNVATVWNVDAGAELHALTGHEGFVRGLAAFRAADGRSMLVTASQDTTARVWDVASGQTVLTFTGHTADDDLSCACLVPGRDGSDLVATAGAAGMIRIWDPVDGRQIRMIASAEPDTENRVVDLAPVRLPSGRPLLAASTEGGLLTIWDPWTGERLAESRNTGPAMGVAAGNPFRSGHDTVVELSVGLGRDGVVWRAIVSGLGHAAPPPLELVVPATPDLELTGHDQRVYGVAWSPSPDASGRRLLATNGGEDLAPRLHDLAAGTAVELHGHEQNVNVVAWEPGGRGRVASAANDHTVRLWEPADGTLLATLTGHESLVYGLTWLAGPNGRTLLVSSAFDDTVRVWDPDTGVTLTVIEGQGRAVRGIAGRTGPDGRVRLVSAQRDGGGLVWDALTGQRLGVLAPPPDDAALSGPVVWGHAAGHDVVAVACSDHSIGLWDPETGRQLRQLTGHRGVVSGLSWTTSPAGEGLLASGGYDRVLRLWDPETGRELAAVHHPGGVLDVSIAAEPAQPPGEGWTLLVATGCDDARARVYRVGVRGARSAVAARPADGEDAAVEAGHVLAAAVPGLLALGDRGLWPPLGLVSDLVALTGPAGGAARLNDVALAPLAAHPNVDRLRRLGWPAPARAAFVALLAADQEHPARYTPPAAEPRVLDGALSAALGRPGPALAPPAARAVRAAADAVGAEDLNLLRILGADACATDPTLPLRLRHVAALLPTMAPDALDVLATAAPQATPPAGPDRRADVVAPVSSPVVTDLARHGAPTRILHTELALPPKVFAHRLRHGQVLHRRTTHRQRPVPSPLTLVLDTTPATYGPVETLLRIVAHLLTGALWGHGVRPALVTLTRPTTVTPLAEPAHLVHLWTSRSLATEADRLDVALRVAADLGQRTVLLTHHARALPAARRLSAGLSIVTTHTPGTAAPPSPVHPRHHHLPPGPDAARLRELVAVLADTGGSDGAA